MAESSCREDGGKSAKRLAVVFFNLGGPDSLEAAQPFLFNLFNDPAIIRAPAPVRWMLAQFISRRRAPFTREIYKKIGGRSPLVPETEKQAAALTAEVKRQFGAEILVSIAMRYWRPFASESVREVAAFDPDEVLLLPLYPQFSTTTTASSVEDWEKEAKKAGLNVPVTVCCCYPDDPHFVRAHAASLAGPLKNQRDKGPVRLLYSAHGLPQKIVDAGDPYAWQVERTAAAVSACLEEEFGIEGIDWTVCYQSRVGPLKWLEPSTEHEIERAGAEGVSLVLTPIAFVSEHSETLVELDMDYAELARSAGVPDYVRIAALGDDPEFVRCLAGLVGRAMDSDAVRAGARLCPVDKARGFGDCAFSGACTKSRIWSGGAGMEG